MPQKIASMTDILNVFNFNTNALGVKEALIPEYSQNKIAINLSKISKSNQQNEIPDMSNIDNVNENLV